MLDFPKRSDTHIMETESWRLLHQFAPKTWVLRDVNERDYGIDFYVEIASKDNLMTGDMMLGQLKAVEKIDWSQPENGVRTARSPSIKCSTASYWLGLPVPVFLFVADLTERAIYVTAADEQIRREFDKLETQKSMTFRMIKNMKLGTKECDLLTLIYHHRERSYPAASIHVANLLSQLETFIQFMAENQHRDIFMEVDAEQHVAFRALHETCAICADYIFMDWPIPSLEKLYQMDHQEWKDDYVYLHEKTHDFALVQIERLFPALVRGVVKRITEIESAYWRKRDAVLYSLCRSGDVFWSVRELEARLERRKKTT